MSDQRIHTNFSVIFKHTMKNVYTRVTTYVAYSVFVVMTTIVLIIVPSLLSGVFAKVVSKGPEVLGNIMEPFTYIASLVLAISVALVSSCVLELNETTFELSRPVNRSTFIGAKSVVAILSNCSMYLWYIIAFLICQAIIASKTSNPHIYIFTNKDIGLNYATLFVPPIFIMFFAIFMTFTLRPFIIKRDGLISLIIVLLVFLTYQLYPIIFLITNTDSSKNSDLKISCLLLPSLVFGIGAIATMLSTSIVYKNLYVKV